MDAGLSRPVGSAELGRLVGVDGHHAWQWATGRREPSAASLRRLSRALKRPAGAILRACELARERRLAKLAALKAREQLE
jgi:transcriptional regulator with XRE-family HTH domain